MKSFLVLKVWIALVAYSHQLQFFELLHTWQNRKAAFIDKCVNETGVDRVLAERLSSFGDYPEDPQLKCFAKCIAVNWGAANEKDGTTIFEGLLDYLDVGEPEFLKKSQVIEKCFSIRIEADACGTTFSVWNCCWKVLQREFAKRELAYREKQTFNDLKTIWQGNMLRHYHSCVQETGVDPVKSLRILKYGEYPEGHEYKCFFSCALRKAHMMYQDGTVNHELFARQLRIHDPDLLDRLDAAKKCFSPKIDDPCEHGYAAGRCVYFIIKEHLENENVEKEL